MVTRYGYCSCGMLTSMTNALGTPVQEVTSYNYDYQGNLSYVYLPDETVTNWFNSLGQQTVTSDGWGYHTNAYNNQGLLTNKSDFYGLEQATIYDNEDRPFYVTDANGVTITNTYDVLARVLTRGYPDGGLEKFGYSAGGWSPTPTKSATSPSTATTRPAARSARPTPMSRSLSYTNNAAGDLLSLTDAKSHTTKWDYDPYGRVTNKLDQTGTEILRTPMTPTIGSPTAGARPWAQLITPTILSET